MVAMIKPLKEMNAFARKERMRTWGVIWRAWLSLNVVRVLLFKLLQDPDFNLAGFTILGDSTNDLDGNSTVVGSIYSFNNLTERSLPQQTYSAI